ncbi:TIGR04141 family sporadically distributed protein [Rhodanobacter umsongensis]|uniref:TIGR04141 family sporadically distributed protein n=1 Tax=Rhodanobacter umsongensis TaxID=633153 RepID=A0ABW0JS87_9GAMM
MSTEAQEARFAVNVYLLRDGVGTPTSVLDFSGLNDSISVFVGPDNAVAQLHYGRTSGAPDWLVRLFQMSHGSPELPKGASISGLLPVPVNGRHFILTFGHAWQKIKPKLIEPNFGIRCVLNLAETNSLRGIRRDRIAEDTLQAIEQIPDSDDISRFGMDLEKDLLRGVKAKVDPALGYGRWVAGGDSFKTSLNLSEESFASFLARCLALYSAQTYKGRFEWVDNIVPLRDSGLVEKLEYKLAELVAHKSSTIAMSAPALLSWNDHDYFSFEKKRKSQSPSANYLDIGHWVEHAALKGVAINPEALFKEQIYAFRQGEQSFEHWSLIECLHAVVPLDDRLFLAHAGFWFELSKSFVAEIEKRVGEIPVSKIILPSTTVAEKEGDYNARVALDSSGALLLLDKKLIWHGGGQSRFELCDLLSQDGQLVCVKPWGGASGSLSHLFYQAKNAITLINKDSEFVPKVRDHIGKIDANFVDILDYVCKYPNEAEVVLAVIRGCKKESLPFFAKLALCDCVTDLRSMRFTATYMTIDVV